MHIPTFSLNCRAVALAAVLGLGAGALVLTPAGNPAFAKNDGDHGHSGEHGNGKGGSGSHGSNSGASDNGHGNSGPDGGSSDSGGLGNGKGQQKQASDDDGSLSPSGLGKLNGFFHASPSALANASPNSPLGEISHAFRDALSAYAANGASPANPDGTTTIDGPTTDDLGAILAGATNRPVTAAQVRAIAGRLAEMNPTDAGLARLAGDPDDSGFQGIADAANRARLEEASADAATADR
jgi:hypothetical protein